MQLSCNGRVKRTANGMMLELEKQGGCRGCAAAGSCATALIEHKAPQRTLNHFPAGSLTAESKVTLDMPARLFSRLVLFCYLMPAVLLVCGAWLGMELSHSSDLGAFMGAFVALMVGSGLLRLYDSRGGGLAWFRRIKISAYSRAESQA